MQRTKRPFKKHQRLAFTYSRTQHPALFMEMRLGKTLVTIRRCLTYAPRDAEDGLKILVVAPNSALGSWEDELDLESIKWFRIIGTAKQRRRIFAEALDWQGCAFILTNKESHRAIGDLLRSVDWDAIILDESTFIKNPKARVTKFYTNNFEDVPHKWILTGTPNPEDDAEFVTQFQFLTGRFMGFDDYWKLRSILYYPHPAGHGWQPKKGVRKQLQKEVGRRAFVLRRKDAGLAKEKIHEVRKIEFPPKMRKMYDLLEQDFLIDGLDGQVATTIWASAKYQWLRQLCGGFHPEGGELHQLKSKVLLELLQTELRGEQLVVWFNYNQELDAVTKLLRKKKFKVASMKGFTKIPERKRLRKQFQAGKIQVLCVQQAIAQMGMDLSAGDISVYYSAPPGYLAWKQTQDRILSMDKTGSLLFIHLLIDNSVDMDLYSALNVKGLESTRTLTQALTIATKERMERNAKANT